MQECSRIKTQNIRVVRFVVLVKIYRHESIGYVLAVGDTIFLVVIAYENYCVVVYGVTFANRQCSYSIADCIIDM